MATEDRPYPEYFEILPPWLREQAEGTWDNGLDWDGSQLPSADIDRMITAVLPIPRPIYSMPPPPEPDEEE